MANTTKPRPISLTTMTRFLRILSTNTPAIGCNTMVGMKLTAMINAINEALWVMR